MSASAAWLSHLYPHVTCGLQQHPQPVPLLPNESHALSSCALNDSDTLHHRPCTSFPTAPPKEKPAKKAPAKKEKKAKVCMLSIHGWCRHDAWRVH